MPGRLKVEREVTVGHSRLDLRLTDPEGRVAMVEVKNCTLAENKVAYFPDAATARGEKHLRELAGLVHEGLRAAVFILVQRNDADCFSPADHLDPLWSARLREVAAEGVEVWVYEAEMDLEKIRLGRSLPVNLNLPPLKG
jgi:DNA-binding protein, stimulates sugar fermentation